MPYPIKKTNKIKLHISNTSTYGEPQKDKSEFFGFFIPAQILWMDDLTQNEKLLLSFMVSLSRKKRTFYGSNEYLEKNLGISKATATKSVGTLERKGYISKISFNGRERQFSFSNKTKQLREDYDKLKSRVINNSRLTPVI